MSIINKLLAPIMPYIVISLLALIVWFFGKSTYLSYSLDKSNDNNEKLERKIVSNKLNHMVDVFENNETIIFQKTKEIKDEEVPSSIGFHTIIFDDDDGMR